MTPAERLVYACALAVAIAARDKDPFAVAKHAVNRLAARAHRLRLEPDSMLSEFLAGEEK